MVTRLILAIAVLLGATQAVAEPKAFVVEIVRQYDKNGLVHGTIGVNNAGIGGAFENVELKIPAGTYKGVLRYWSKKNFVQGPLGKLGNVGDFLLEVTNVKDGKKSRTDILFHAGNAPHHSLGCILLGPVSSKVDGAATVNDKHPLRVLRRMFYGTDDPVSSPNKEITIVITDAR